MKKVPKKGPINARTTRRFIFFMPLNDLLILSKPCSKKLSADNVFKRFDLGMPNLFYFTLFRFGIITKLCNL